MMGCTISSLLFVLVMEMILHCAENNTNEITDQSMKAFMDVVTLFTECKSHMEQSLNRLQKLFKWDVMKMKPPNVAVYLYLKESTKTKFCFNGNEIPKILEKSVKNLGRYYSLPQSWWSKESTIKMKNGIGRNSTSWGNQGIATAVGQMKQGAWTKGESAKDRAVTWSNLKHMGTKILSFLIKAVYEVLPTPVNLHAWRLTTSDQCKACGKTANPIHIVTGCEYALRSYT